MVFITPDPTVDIDIEAQTLQREGHVECKSDSHETTHTDKVSCEENPDDGKRILGLPRNGSVTNKTRLTTQSSQKDPGPPPDGGWVAWKQDEFMIPCPLSLPFVCMALMLWVFLSHPHSTTPPGVIIKADEVAAALGHLVIMCTWGFINSFGVFQAYYVITLNRSPSDISWVGSIQVFLLFFVGTSTGRLTDAGYFRLIFLIGSFFAVLGIFMTSLSTKYWHLFLAQGVCCGLGNGFLFCPSLSLLSTYFTTRRSLAIGLAAAGSATGGMLFPGVVKVMLPRVGYSWTMRTLGFIQLAFLTVCNIGIRPRMPPRRSGALVDWKSFRETPYVLFAFGMFFTFWGVYFAFFYVTAFGRTIIGLPYNESLNLLIVLNGVGVLGRVVPNFIADKLTGPLNMLIPVVGASSVLVLFWIIVDSRDGLYAWSVIYGIVGAAIQSLFPATLSSLTTDLRMAGTRMGQVFTIVSFAVLTGPPIAGQLLQRKGGGYEYAQLFSACDLLVGCGLLIVARLTKSRKVHMKI